MSRLRWAFKSQQSTGPTTPHQNISPSQQKDLANAVYWQEADGTEQSEKGKAKEVERLWGYENFGNTCYCNSVLQALYSCGPFREFVESYPDVLPPQIPLGPLPDQMNTTPLSPSLGANGSSSRPSSPLATVKGNPFDAAPSINGSLNTPMSPSTDKSSGKEKRGWASLGRKPTLTSAPTLATLQQGQVAQIPLDPPAEPPSVKTPEPELDPNLAPPTVFATIQTLFYHLNTSPPHQPAPPKTPANQTNANVTAAALATSNGNSLPSASLVANGTTPNSGNQANGKDANQPPPLLASLPPPSAPRGGGPFQAGTLGRGVVRPEDLLRTVKRENEMFRGMSQQDAHEFLGWMLNRIAEEVDQLDKERRLKEGKESKGNGKTFVQNLFEGTLTNETRCLSCETTSSRDELFLDLSIDIEQHTSVTACLRQFSASEMLCQKNKFFCETCCGLQEAEKRMKIKRLPNVLALHLKRFKYQENLGRYVKLSYRVPFPTQLRLPNTSDDAEDPDRLYELFAVVVHIGNGPHHGHYVAIVKSAGRWVMCDDENIEPIEESDIPRYFGDYPSGAGYVLFYQAVDLNLSSLGLRRPVIPSEPVNLMDLAELSISDTVSPPRIEVATVPFTPVLDPSPVSEEDPFADTPLYTVDTPSKAPQIKTPNGYSIQPPTTTPTPPRIETTSPKSKDNGTNWFSRKSTKDKKKDGITSLTTVRANSGDTVTIGRGSLARQATSTTMNSVSTASTTFGGLGLTVNSSMAGENAEGVMGIPSNTSLPSLQSITGINGIRQIPTSLQKPIPEASPAAMSSSIVSSFSASSGTTGSNSGTTSSNVVTPQNISTPPVSLAQPISTGPSGFSILGRRESKKDRIPSGASVGSMGNGNSGGGGSLGRRLSGMKRSGSMAFKMGFGKKDKDKDKDRD